MSGIVCPALKFPLDVGARKKEFWIETTSCPADNHGILLPMDCRRGQSVTAPGAKWLGCSAGVAAFVLSLLGCTSGRGAANRDGEADAPGSELDAGTDDSRGDAAGPAAVGTARVTIDVTAPRAVVPPLGLGLHASVYDNALHATDVPALLKEAGVALLRWPGGGYADNYHWSIHRMTPWFNSPSQAGYLAPGSDFGGFVALLASFDGAAMITVNYGSNLAGDGPGEPKEAAAWVAYANGDPASEVVIGVDSTGRDWGTVGSWATLRASDRLAADDGKNFLRLAHPDPLGIRYWEIGNEVFGNGFYTRAPAAAGAVDAGAATLGYEEDLHVPYDGTTRSGHPSLSGSTYGAGVRTYVEAMKAVDPSIKIGAVLNTPPNDYSWGPTWNMDVLQAAGPVIDFAIVHLYTGRNPANLLRAPAQRVQPMTTELRNLIATYCGDNAGNVELMMTELGPNFAVPDAQAQAAGLFAADAYVSLLEAGFANVDWLELHNGSFLVEQTQVKGPAFNGIRMAHLLATPGDTLVTASSDANVIVAHAAARADGTLGVMLINTQPAASTLVTVSVSGATLGPSGSRFDYAPEGPAANGSVTGPTPVDGIGNELSVMLPPYTAVDLVLPAAAP